MLSLVELQRKKIEAKRKKYDKDEMDSYLELVYENYKQLTEQNKKLEAEKNELTQKAKKLSDGVQYYRSIETTLQKALILAEKTSKETKDAALMKAEAIEKDANKRADEIIRTAEGEYNKIKDKCMLLVQQFNQYKHQMIEAASAQLELVEGDEFDLGDPDKYEQTSHSSAKREKTRPAPQPEPVPQPKPTPQPEPVPQPKPVSQPEPALNRKTEIQPKKEEPVISKPTPEDILRADTIDLRATLDTIQSLGRAAVGDSDLSLEPNAQPAGEPLREESTLGIQKPEPVMVQTAGAEERITKNPDRTFSEGSVQAQVQPQAQDQVQPRIQPQTQSQDEIQLQTQPQAQDEILLQTQPQAQDEILLQTQPQAQDEILLQTQPQAQDEILLQTQPQAQDEIQLQTQPQAQDEIQLQIQPQAQDEIQLQVAAAAQDPTDMLIQEPSVSSNDSIELASVKDAVPVAATVVEPVQAKTVEPLDAMFESEISPKGRQETQAMKLEPAAKEPESVPTLDALLQDLNINNRNNQKSDDPFEFLGSIDDDF